MNGTPVTAPTESTSDAPRCSRRCRLAVLLVLFLLPLGLRLWSIDHGSPRNYVEDTHIVKNALGMAKDQTIAPPVNKYSSYPNLLPYMLLPIYVGQMTIGIADGSFDGVDGYTNHVKEHPESAQILARILIALFGALTPWVIFRIARVAGMQSGAWVAAWLVGTGLLHIHYSVQERPWVPVIFFMALAAWPAAIYAREGGMKRLIWSGVFAGLSFACHQSGAAALGIPGLAWLFGPPGWSKDSWLPRIKVGVAAVVSFVVVGILFGHLSLLLTGENIPGVNTAASAAGGFSIGGQGIVFGFSLESFVIQLKTLFGYDPVLLPLGMAGAGGLFLRRELRPIGIFTLAWAAFFFFHENHKVRYVLPVAVFLPLFAGHFYETWASGRMKRAWVLLLVALPIIPAVRFVCLLGQPDSRAVAEEQLAELADARIVIDRFGPAADLDLASLTELQTIRAAESHGTLRVREQHRFDVFTAGGTHLPPGINGYRLEDLLMTDELAGTVELRPGTATTATDVAGMLRERGVTHFLLVRRNAGTHLLEELVSNKQPLWTVDPSGADAYEACRLPKDMVFPILDLWRVERPGPWMALYKL